MPSGRGRGRFLLFSLSALRRVVLLRYHSKIFLTNHYSSSDNYRDRDIHSRENYCHQLAYAILQHSLRISNDLRLDSAVDLHLFPNGGCLFNFRLTRIAWINLMVVIIVEIRTFPLTRKVRRLTCDRSCAGPAAGQGILFL